MTPLPANEAKVSHRKTSTSAERKSMSKGKSPQSRGIEALSAL
jgi:hypothetical protein